MKATAIFSLLFAANLANAGPLKSVTLNAQPGSEFIKLSLIFEKDEKFAKIAVIGCGSSFKDGADFFFYPGFRSAYSEAGKDRFAIKIPQPQEPIRTIAVVFDTNTDVCISSIKVWNRKGVEIALSGAIAPTAVSPVAIPASASTEVLKDIVDREFTNKEQNDRWAYRFRSDGTFFIRGYAEDMDSGREFSALGNYKVTGGSKKSVKLEISGSRYGTPSPWDGIVCTTECGMSEPVNAVPVKEELEIERTKGGALFVRNRSERSRRTLPFSDLKVRPSTLVE